VRRGSRPLFPSTEDLREALTDVRATLVTARQR
jgi:hypothetical protein